MIKGDISAALVGPECGVMTVPRVLDEFEVNHFPLGVTKTVRVRGYQPADRPAIRQLCFQTGFLGSPADKLFQDSDLFADLFTKPYLQYEPAWALVAETEGRLVGYLLGSVSRQFELWLLYSGLQTTSKMLFRLWTGRYAGHPRSRQFVRWLLTAGFREQPRHPAHAAHLHLNVDRLYRGRGVGMRLWEVYERQLRSAGFKHCYGAFFSYPRRRPESVYARLGFAVYDRRRTSLFQPEIGDPVEVVCVHKWFNGDH